MENPEVSPPSQAELAVLLADYRRGDETAADRVLPLVYEELRRLARFYLRQERSGHTLQPTALVHEAYLRLMGQETLDWKNRAQFLGVAARMMRRILVNYGEARNAAKRSAPHTYSAPAHAAFPDAQVLEAMALHHALEELRGIDPRQEKIIDLRFYLGLNLEETADAMGLSVATVKREWAVARLWIRKQIAAGVADAR